jgi:hypothetical protein
LMVDISGMADVEHWAEMLIGAQAPLA